jgi:ferredoxin-NADP reductase
MMSVETSIANESLRWSTLNTKGHNVVKVKSVTSINHDVLLIQTVKPKKFFFKPGQAVEISINKDGWRNEIRPFTMTSLPYDDYLEFTIKTYPSHEGVTNQLRSLISGDELILHKVFGTIAYKGEGVFIAGGAGVTPYISIFRFLKMIKETGENKLILANKAREDIINEVELKRQLNGNYTNILAEEVTENYDSGLITLDFLKSHIGGIDKMFYICGPPAMMDAVEKHLKNLHVEDKSIIKEIF